MGVVKVEPRTLEETKDAPENFKCFTFAKSPIMSTYLVAWSIGDLEAIKPSGLPGSKINCYVLKGKLVAEDLGRKGLDMVSKTLSYLTRYFGIETQPMKKVDIIAMEREMRRWEIGGLPHLRTNNYLGTFLASAMKFPIIGSEI